MAAVPRWIIFADMKQRPLPWYMKDKFGYPIEFIMGSSAPSRWLRILFINVQKLGGRPKSSEVRTSNGTASTGQVTSFRSE